MATRVDCGDRARARQHVFLVPGKYGRPARRRAGRARGRAPTAELRPAVRKLRAPTPAAPNPAQGAGRTSPRHRTASWSRVIASRGFQSRERSREPL